MTIIILSLLAFTALVLIGAVAVICVTIFTAQKYGSTNQVAELTTRVEALESRDSLDPRDINDRIITLENRAGVMIGGRR